MKRFALLLLLFALGLLSACAARQQVANTESPYRDPSTLEEGRILHLATGRLLTEEELYANLAHFQVIYVGETHDNVEAHAVQLKILQALYQRFPGQVAMGMEMLRRPYQPEVDAYLAGELGDEEFLRIWEKNWAPGSFDDYRDLLDFCRERDIPVLALNPGRDLEKAVASESFPTDPQLTEELPEMDFSDPYYRSVMEAYFDGHGGGSGQLEIFHRVQVLRDESMAAAAAAFMGSPEGSGRRLLIFAGANHVRYGFGVPRRLYRRRPAPYAVVDTVITDYPESKRDRLMDVELPDLPLRPADFYWAVGYKDRAEQQVPPARLDPLLP